MRKNPLQRISSQFPRLGRVCLLYWGGGGEGSYMVWAVSVGRKETRHSHPGITDCCLEEVGAIAGMERGGV